jgi:hypothetical protein
MGRGAGRHSISLYFHLNDLGLSAALNVISMLLVFSIGVNLFFIIKDDSLLALYIDRRRSAQR